MFFIPVNNLEIWLQRESWFHVVPTLFLYSSHEVKVRQKYFADASLS